MQTPRIILHISYNATFSTTFKWLRLYTHEGKERYNIDRGRENDGEKPPLN